MSNKSSRCARIMNMVPRINDDHNSVKSPKMTRSRSRRHAGIEQSPILLRPRSNHPCYAPPDSSINDSLNTTPNDNKRDETYIPTAEDDTDNSLLSITNSASLLNNLSENEKSDHTTFFFETSDTTRDLLHLENDSNLTSNKMSLLSTQTLSTKTNYTETLPRHTLMSDSLTTSSPPLIDVASNVTIEISDVEELVAPSLPPTLNQQIISTASIDSSQNVLADDTDNSFIENSELESIDHMCIFPSESEESNVIDNNQEESHKSSIYEQTNVSQEQEMLICPAERRECNVITNNQEESYESSIYEQPSVSQEQERAPDLSPTYTAQSLSPCASPVYNECNTIDNDVFESSNDTTSEVYDSDEDETFNPALIQSSSDSSDDEETNNDLVDSERQALEEFQVPTSMRTANKYRHKAKESSRDRDSSDEEQTNTTMGDAQLQSFGELQAIAPSTTTDENQHKSARIRTKDFCFFCETDILNFARHMTRNHAMEPEVQKIISYPKKSCIRKKLLTDLRKKGNYITNVSKCVKPMKMSNLNHHIDYLPCEKCLGFYSRKQLWKHRKACQPLSKTSNTQVEAQNFMLRNLTVDKKLKTDVFPKMRADRVSLEAKKDTLICAFGAQYLRIHREKHFICVTSRKMRELAKLLIELKKLKPTLKDLMDCLKPQNYDIIVTATKKVSSYDDKADRYGAPTYAMNISTSLKQCCNIAIMNILKSGNSVQTATMEADVKTLIQLIEANWKFDVSSQASNDLNLKKWNKITIVPLASDLKLLKHHLCEKAKTAASKLRVTETSNVEAYNSLLETTYCRVILLNRRRPGELQRLLLSTYQECSNDSNAYEEFDRAISATEKLLINNFKRIVIRGKRGRGVPVLFTDDVQNDINLLISIRRKYIPDANNFLFAKPGSATPLCGYKVLEKYAKTCGAKNPKAITTTKLRKHLATLTQMLNLKDSDIEQLANFMGHTQSVHRQNYRLPDDVYQTAKISKLLLLMESGKADSYKGKALDEIDIDLEQDLLKETLDENENNDDIVEYDEIIPSQQISEITSTDVTADKQEAPSLCDVTNSDAKLISTKKKRNLVPWTPQQKKIVLTFFKNHLKCKRPPKRHECEELRSQHPDILNNKDWLKIKVFVQNTYTKKT